VRSDDLALTPGLIDKPDFIGRLAPGHGTERLQVRDVSRQAAFAADGDRFVDGIKNARAFISDMAGVEAAVPGRHADEGDELILLSIGARIVLKARGQTP